VTLAWIDLQQLADASATSTADRILAGGAAVEMFDMGLTFL
jgi:hypothetical protein